MMIADNANRQRSEHHADADECIAPDTAEEYVPRQEALTVVFKHKPGAEFGLAEIVYRLKPPTLKGLESMRRAQSRRTDL